nr:zinc finger protein 791-like [Lytechinus pictus]
MMKYAKRFQCKICLLEVRFITQVIDHIQNEHPDQIAGFRTSLGPHFERCGLTVVWSLPELDTSSSRTTPGTGRSEGSVKNVTDAPDDESTSALKLSNDKNGGEDEREGGEGFPMGGGILKGGYMSLLVGDEANTSARVGEAQEGDKEPDTNSKKADEGDKEGDVNESGDRRAVAVREDGQTDDLFKDRQDDPRVTNLEEDVDVLYELQGWVVIMIECPDCQEYVSIYSLPKHQFLHNKPKQEHECDVCHKVYRRLNLLRNHQKRHQEKPPKPLEEKTFMCELCGDVFRKAKYLKNHQLRHQGNLPFVCKICDRRFLFQRQLKRHDIIHRDVKPILCQECGRGFVQRSQLNAHMRQHTGEKPYKCDLCERAFTHNVSLKTHKKRDHGVQVGKCANPHLGRPKMSGEGAPKTKGTRAASSRKASQARNQTVINNPPTSQYSECRMVNPGMNHLPLGLVINPERQGMDLSIDSSDSPPGMDSNRGAPMQSRTADRSHRERQASMDRQSTTMHNMDTHSRPNHSESHSNMEHLGNPHIERSVINMERHTGNGEGNNSANSGGSHNSHPHFDRAMAMPLIERSLPSHLIDRQGLSPPIDTRPGNAHSHHMDHHHHQGGIPLIARPDLNQHLMRQKKGKELEMPPHQNNPSHPPYPWGAWGNVGEGMGMRFPVFPQ